MAGRHAGPTQQQCDLALEIFDHFCSAGTQKMILGLHRELCNCLNLKSNRLLDFYPKLKVYFTKSWRATALFKKFDLRANQKVYANGRACPQNKVLIIGAGPCGLRTAIECQLLGAKVVVVEKRDRMSRNNVLHLWPFVIEDLRALGAKQFFGKFCAGDINHISIRQLQCILLKVALLLGVEFHESVSFEELLEPTVTTNSEVLGWRARVSPEDHPVSQYEFDVLIGADGKRNTLQNFKRTEFRGKLALAITANFINRHTEQEASVPEISGVAFIFRQTFFKDMNRLTGIDLENIVYYKDDTHYFVMTAKKPSLLSQGVLKKDYTDVARLLSVDNVDRDKLIDYAKRAANFATDGKLPTLDFALNHYGDPDVALFDFTSMFFAENASSILERQGRRLLCQLVGDSLLEPFWPTGSGCARGFLSSLDASWAVRSFAQTPSPHPLEIIAERESIYRLLAQTTPENLSRDLGAYALDPGTRYPNLNRTIIPPDSQRVVGFYDSDDPLPLEENSPTRKRKRAPEPEVNDEALIAWIAYWMPGIEEAACADSLAKVLRRYRPDLLPPTASSKLVYTVLQKEFGIPTFSVTTSTRNVPIDKLRHYLHLIYNIFKGDIPHINHQSNYLDQIKQNQQKEKSLQNTRNHLPSAFSTAAEAHKKKRRSSKSQVSNDPAEFLRKKIGKLEINDITKLTRLIEGHDAIQNDNEHNTKQKELQEQIIALLDPEDSPDPKMFRESVSHLLQGATKTKLKPIEISEKSIARFFQDIATEQKPSKPPRKLKGLNVESIKVPDFSDIFDNSADIDTTVIKAEPELNSKIETTTNVKKKQFVRSASIDSPLPPTNRRLSEVVVGHRERSSQSPEIQIHKVRSNSIGAVEIEHNTKRIAQIFEGNKRRHTPSPESRFVRSGSISNPDIVLRLQRMEEIIEGKRVSSPSPDRSKRSESIGNPEMALRRQKVAELIEGYKPQRNLSPEPIPLRRNSREISFRVQRVSDMMQKRNEKRPKTSRRKAAREIMKQRFEKSVQMLATEPRFDFTTTDLENDYGLQQYRASALQFGERVKKLEKKLQHHAEARAVGSETRATRRGHRIIELAANLSGPSPVINLAPPSKPKDLLRAVGRLERDDWNVKEIEKRILENRLGRPEPGTAERVPKWDRKEFLDRQKRLKEGCSEERWRQSDENLKRLDTKRRDNRPELGTNMVANLAKSFAEKYMEVGKKLSSVKESVTPRKIWERPTTTGMTCASCSKSVFAAEAVIADGIHLHRSCFRCAVCKTTLRPGNYTTERNGVRLVCLRHADISVPDTAVSGTAVSATALSATAESSTAVALSVTAESSTAVALSVTAESSTAVAVKSPVIMTRTVIKPPERISIRLSTGSTKIDEDEWTDRNFLQSETSGAGGLSDISEPSSEDDDEEDDDEDAAEYDDAEDDGYGPVAMTRQKYSNHDSDESFGYDDASDDVVESSGNESCSRMREAREARRKEVPTAQLPPTDSSEVESDEESESSEEEISSATEVSTDSEFAREEIAVQPSPPAILVTEPIPPPPPPPRPQDYPLSRTRSAGGLATKRALELKRRYLLGEPSPPAVRKSDSTSQLDTKIEAFRTNITEFQKMLHPAPIAAARNITVAFHVNVEKPPEEVKSDRTLDSDSFSEDSHTQRMPNQTVPIVEVHNEGGELIQHNSTLININTYNTDEKVSGDVSGTTVVAAESESSESCRDATTLALTETELSDWAAESIVLDDCGLEDKEDRRRSKNPRTLSGPKIVHDAKNVTALSSHVCGRTSPEKVMFSNALEYFEFADEGDQDPSIEKSEHPVNEGFMEIVHEFDHDSPKTEPKNFIESFSEMIVKPNLNATINRPDDSLRTYINKQVLNGTNYTESFNSDMSPPLEHSKIEDFIDTPKRTYHNKTNNNEEMISPPLTDEHYDAPSKTTPCTLRVYSPAICRSRSENFHHLNTSHSTLPRTEDLFANTPPLTSESSCTVNSNANDIFLSPSIVVMSSETSSTGSTATSNNLSILSPSVYSMPSTIEKSPSPQQNKVLEINKDRQKQMEVVRGLVLERLGNGPRLNRRCSKRPRMTVVSNVPPPVPPLPTFQMTPPQTPPALDTCLPPPRPAPPVMPLPVMTSLSDPELTKEKRNKSILNSITKYLNRHFRPRDKWPSESDLLQQINRPLERMDNQYKSTGALEELALPVSRLSALSPPRSSFLVPETGHTMQETASVIMLTDEEDEDVRSPNRNRHVEDLNETIQTLNDTTLGHDDCAAEKDDAPRSFVTFRSPNRNRHVEVLNETGHTMQETASVIILTDEEDEEDVRSPNRNRHVEVLNETIQTLNDTTLGHDDCAAEKDDAPRSFVTFRSPNRNRHVEVLNETGHTMQETASVIILTDEEDEDVRSPNRNRHVEETRGFTQDPEAEREARKNFEVRSQERRAKLQRKLSKQTSAEGQAKAVAEYLQMRAQREAHQALKAADEKRKKRDHPK